MSLPRKMPFTIYGRIGVSFCVPKQNVCDYQGPQWQHCNFLTTVKIKINRERQMQTIAITGATGFVGSALFQTLRVNPKYTVKGFCRTLPKEGTTEGLLALGNLESADFTEALAGVDVVIHTAARAKIGR